MPGGRESPSMRTHARSWAVFKQNPASPVPEPSPINNERHSGAMAKNSVRSCTRLKPRRVLLLAWAHIGAWILCDEMGLRRTTCIPPQTDGQSECKNQTVEIALRHWLTANPNTDFTGSLPYIQAYINDTMSSATGHTPNEVSYAFRVRDNLDLLSDIPAEDHKKLRLRYRETAEKSIAWANMISNMYYDKKHTSLYI